MKKSRPVILPMRANNAVSALIPEGVMYFGPDTMIGQWDYCHPVTEGRVLDERIYTVAAEYATIEKPDLIVLSTPTRRLLTGVHTKPSHIYECLCHMAEQGTLYALVNKMPSRALWAAMGSGTQTERLTRAFLRINTMLLLSHPWVEITAAPAPADDEFFALVDHYVARRERT